MSLYITHLEKEKTKWNVFLNDGIIGEKCYNLNIEHLNL